MQAHRFDVLPIAGSDAVSEYFRTAVWGDYGTIHRTPISDGDVVPLSSPIREIVRGFATESRDFYFLASDRHVVGLISVVNLNCRPVKVWLFSLLSELETKLGAFLMTYVSETEILDRELAPGCSPGFQDARKRYDNDRARGIDAPLIEYLYLSNLINVIAKRGLFDRLGYKSRGAFETHFNPMNELRNSVVHPLRSLALDQSCVKLWGTLERVEQALSKLSAA